MYPAPLSQWAWWDTFRLNVPFLTLEGPAIAKALRDNITASLTYPAFLAVVSLAAVVVLLGALRSPTAQHLVELVEARRRLER